MVKQYISQIVTQEEIEKWVRGDRILISSGTGSGKTTLILEKIYSYCKNNNLKILLLVNRMVLQNQIIKILEKKYEKENWEEVISVQLYQSIEGKIMKNRYISDEVFNGYNVICMDESHYFTSDSIFSFKSDLLLKVILQDNPNKILIFMTATPYNLTELNLIRNTIPANNVEQDFSFISHLYFYNKKMIPELVCKSIPEGDKIIYFGSPIDSYDLSKKFDNSIFICSKSNKIYTSYDKDKKKLMDNAIETLSLKSRFEEKYLFTTRVLDNGVSIEDNNVSHIIIDDSIDPITVIQMLGRKRIMGDNDKINLYIKNNPRYIINKIVNTLEAEIKKIKQYTEIDDQEEFIYKNKKTKLDDSFDSDAELNIAKAYGKIFRLKKYKIMMKNENKMGYIHFMCNVLNRDIDDFRMAERYFIQMGSIEILKKYSGRKLFKEEQEQFSQEFLQAMLEPKKNKPIGFHTVDGLIRDNFLPFQFSSFQEKSKFSQFHGKTYWFITDVNSFDS